MPIFSSLFFSRTHAASSWRQLVFPTLLIGLVVVAYARLRMAQHQDQLEDKESAASTAARQRGNESYKNKDLERAIEAYQEAASLAPNDPAPLSNLSAVCFETGRYADAANFIRQALRLSQAEPDQSPKKQKLYARLVKSLLYANTIDNDEAATALQHLHDSFAAEGVSKHTLQANVAEVRQLWASVPDSSRLRALIFDRLPRFRPYINDVPEYFSMGHDDCEDFLSKKQVEAMAARQDNIALMFCGSGDARHVLSTLMLIGRALGMGADQRIKTLHFSLVDIKPAALAKFVLIFHMLIRYATMKGMKTQGHEDVLVVVAYLYTCQVIPPFVLEKLYQHLDLLILLLQDDRDFAHHEVLPFIYIPPNTRRAILKVFKQWRHPVSSHYAVSRIRPIIRQNVKMTRSRTMAAFGPEDSVSKKDRKDFDAWGCLFADMDFFQRREPELATLYRACQSNASASKRKELEDYLDAKWSVNVTLLDSDHEATMNEDLDDIARYYASGCEPWSVHDESVAHLGEFDPSKTLEAFMRGAPYTVLKGMGMFFDGVAVTMVSFLEALRVELVLGEMTDFMDRVHFDSLEYRSCAPTSDRDVDPRTFPKTYDLIHLSNIPDYIGGHLTTFLGARPLLRDHKQASLRFVNLLNPPMFESHEDFQAEYLLMPDDKQIKKHFHLVRKADPLDSMFGGMMPMGFSSFAMEGYFDWRPAPVTAIPSKQLMNREQLETWIYRLAIKICLPCPRPLFSDRPVYAPLNLTIVLRLLAHLFVIGYPAHWLSSIIASICEGRITTRARPPWDIVMPLEDLAAHQPKIEVSLGAWQAEFTTIFATGRRVLPFGVILPQGGMPLLPSIREYSVTFPTFRGERFLVPHFILVFWDTQNARGREPPPNLLEPLCFDHMGATKGIHTTTLKTGIRIMTTFRFTSHTRTASFWMREDVVQEMKAGTWKVYIWRTDDWNRLTPGVDAREGLEEGQRWADS